MVHTSWSHEWTVFLPTGRLYATTRSLIFVNTELAFMEMRLELNSNANSNANSNVRTEHYHITIIICDESSEE